MVSRTLPNSSRSTQSIINLADHLVDWTHSSGRPVKDAHSPGRSPHLEPTPPGDPQTNPPDDPQGIYLINRQFTPRRRSWRSLIRSNAGCPTTATRRWRCWHTHRRCRRACRRAEPAQDRDGRQLAAQHHATRATSGALGNLLRCLGDPGSPTQLATAFRVWARQGDDDEIEKKQLERTAQALIRKCGQVEAFLLRLVLDRDWLAEGGLAETDPEVYDDLVDFRRVVRRWQAAAPLPVDQLVLTLSQDIFDQPAELALSHKLAVLLRRASEAHAPPGGCPS